TATIEIGASICTSGCCLTVVAKGDDWFEVDASAETLGCSSLGDWREGTPVNLERSLRVGDELGGHIVTGHVDAVGRIETRRPEGDSVRFVFSVPPRLSRFIAPKGSVAVNGVSLTVNEAGPDSFGVNVIPHTLKMTTFGELEEGDRVNVEIDVLARYVARLTGAEG
ncbi:MAG: riboflavin synthase, partial [Alphaproteobacteria bacterium]|nr:riboflavin synthase [Alphaproteobacteria bacterium]